MKKFPILSSEIILDEPFIRVRKERVLLPNQKEADWYITLGMGAVIILPVLSTGEIVLQRTYKHGCGEIVVEFCAGIIEKHEDIQTAAARELAEETGYTTEKMEYLGEFFANPTGSTQKYFIFLARDCTKTQETAFDDAEQIENFTVQNIEEVEKILFDPQIKTSTPAIAALAFLRKFL